MKKVLSLVMSFIFLFTCMSTPTFANIIENDSEVIAIVDGKEITKSDINEYGLINQSIMDAPSLNIISKNNSVPSTLYVKKGQNALMVKKLVAPSFSQQTDLYFLNPSKAIDFANELTASSNLSIVSTGIIAITLGYAAHPHVGALYTGALMLKGLYLNTLKTEILKLADAGKSVEVRMIKSTMNSSPLYYVGEWNGTTIKTNLTNTTTTKEEVTFYKTN